MIKALASFGAFSLAACAFVGAAAAQSPYSPPVETPGYRYALPPEALAGRPVLPSGLVYEGRSVNVQRPAATNHLPEAPAFPTGLPLNLEPKPRSSTGSSFRTMYA
jgi:hypothetical protein